jgi:hypothetical protein
MRSKFTLVILLLLFISIPAIAQISDSMQHEKTKKIVLGSIAGGTTTGSLIYLNQIWYKSYTSGSFHFFNDTDEWLQMDKAGHAFTTYTCGRILAETMQRAGFKRGHSIFIGGTSGLIYMTAIEIMDGFSNGWGFSWSDMTANSVGCALAVSQQYFLNEQRICIKYSFHQTIYPSYRPGLLGTSLQEQMIKDYNGQTYWLSANIASFLNKKTSFPKWLNLAIGYSAEGMISGHDPNYVFLEPNGQQVIFSRYRKCLISLDLDFSRIKVRSRLIKNIFSLVNCVKIPFPAIEFSQGVKFHPVYF